MAEQTYASLVLHSNFLMLYAIVYYNHRTFLYMCPPHIHNITSRHVHTENDRFAFSFTYLFCYSWNSFLMIFVKKCRIQQYRTFFRHDSTKFNMILLHLIRFNHSLHRQIAIKTVMLNLSVFIAPLLQQIQQEGFIHKRRCVISPN